MTPQEYVQSWTDLGGTATCEAMDAANYAMSASLEAWVEQHGRLQVSATLAVFLFHFLPASEIARFEKLLEIRKAVDATRFRR